MPQRESVGSAELFQLATTVLPGGVSSPVRAFRAVGGIPLAIASANGSRILDVDGNAYIDLVMSWGPLIHGHAKPEIIEAIREASTRGTTFGAPTRVEVDLALLIRDLMPGIERLRFVSSGTEATMSALRLARACTGRELILKFEGCYHGHVDSLLVKTGSGALTHGNPTSAGVPNDVVSLTRISGYNDITGVEAVMNRAGSDIAAIVVEPVAGNMGTVPPNHGFLQALRRLTTQHGALLIFDEVITGFRVDLHGAQGRFGIEPDISCLGKVIGGGLPAAAFGGRREIMELLSPLGPVYQAGTLSGNPIAMTAGVTSLELAQEADYGYLERLAIKLEDGLKSAAAEAGLEVTVNREASMLSLFFTPGPVEDLNSAMRSDVDQYAAFFHAMLRRGVYLPPSQFETWMLSFAHTTEDIDLILEAVSEAFQEISLQPSR